MAALFCLLALSGSAAAKIVSDASPSLSVNAKILQGQPLDGFVSFSIEFASFPDFAGKPIPVTQYT